MKLTSLVRLVALMALLACGLPASLAAQQTESRIVGRALDESKAALPGVTVTITSKQTGAIRTVVTDAEGAYVVTNLGPGGYTVQFELPSFQTQAREVVVGVGEVKTADILLGVGSDRAGRRHRRIPDAGHVHRRRLASTSRRKRWRTCRSTAATSRT